MGVKQGYLHDAFVGERRHRSRGVERALLLDRQLPVLVQPERKHLRVQGSGFRVRGAGCRVQGSGFRVQGSGCRVQGSGFRVNGGGAGVQFASCPYWFSPNANTCPTR